MKSYKPVILGVVLLAAALPLLAKKQASKEAPVADASKAVTGSAPASAIPPETVLVKVGDYQILEKDVQELVGKRISQMEMQYKQELYDLRYGAAEQKVREYLLEAEAKSRGMTVPDLLKAEVEAKTPAPTKEEIQIGYDRVKARAPGKTLEELSPEIERQLSLQKQSQRRIEYVEELRAKSNVQVFLDPPRLTVPIPANAPTRGEASAPVTIVQFSEFQCPFCRRAHGTVQQILEQYPGKIRLVHIDHLAVPGHTRALPAAEASYCANDQGKYWEYHDNLMTAQGDMSDEDLKKRAADVGLDAAAFASCLDSDKNLATVQAFFDQSRELGIGGTPTFTINGRVIVGAKPLSDFKSLIDEELKRVGSMTAKGS